MATIHKKAMLALLSTLMLASNAAASFSDDSYTDPFTGEGTYYGFTANGNCAMRDTLPSIYSGMLPMAINQNQYAGSASCGACVRIISSGAGAGANSIVAPRLGYVHDQCPECAHGDLDLSESGDGRWAITWEFIECPGSNNELNVLFEGSNPYYWKLQVRGTKSPVATLTADGNTGTRTTDNFFEIHAEMPDSAEIVVTTVLGETVSFNLPYFISDGVVTI